jgi:hypothetical protein
MENSIDDSPRRRGRPPMGLEPAVNPLPREEMRDSMREEDSLSSAARRAAELRGHAGGVQDDVDEFYVDPDMIPEGWTYEWKRHLLLGAEDPSYNVSLARAGWEPVNVDRDAKHRAMMPMNWTGAYIERKGMMLMRLPTEIVQENKAFERRKARDQVRAKEAQLSGTPEGTLSRDDPRVRPSINKGWEAMPVPKA